MTLYRKTAKGQTEIETRANRLLPRLRTALILVDGRRDDVELRKLVPGDADEAFRTLLADGYVEAIEAAPERPAPRPAPAPTSAAAPAAARPSEAAKPAALDPKAFENLRRTAVRFLNDQTGPMGEGVAMRMEKARTMDELAPLLLLAQRSIANATGSGAAAEFGRRFIDSAAE